MCPRAQHTILLTSPHFFWLVNIHWAKQSSCGKSCPVLTPSELAHSGLHLCFPGEVQGFIQFSCFNDPIRTTLSQATKVRMKQKRGHISLPMTPHSRQEAGSCPHRAFKASSLTNNLITEGHLYSAATGEGQGQVPHSDILGDTSPACCRGKGVRVVSFMSFHLK